MINSYIERISVVFCKNWIWRLADGVQVVFSGLFLFKIAAPFGIKRARTTHFIVSCRLCLCKPFGRHRGRAAYPTTLQIFFTRCAFWPSRIQRICSHPARQAGNAVLPCATNRQQILEGGCVGRHTNRHEDRNHQRQRKQIRPTRSAGGSNCFYLLILHLLAIQYGVER